MTKEEITNRQKDLEKRLEAITQRRAALVQEVSQMDAEYQATSGALQDCEWWLKTIEKPETKVEKKMDKKLVKTV
tara:strand:+ start:562 stop:786 length:225 start_codon:yes stop_codon:yes gene_type:complete